MFNFKCADVGNLKQVRVGHDNTGIAPGWHLSHVSGLVPIFSVLKAYVLINDGSFFILRLSSTVEKIQRIICLNVKDGWQKMKMMVKLREF